MKKTLARLFAASVGVMVPAIVLATDYNYDDYNYDYNYDSTSGAGDAAAAAFGVGFLAFAFVMGLIGLACTIFVIWMIIDAARRNFDQKVMWILLMVFLGFIPAVIYFFMIKKKNVGSVGVKTTPTAAIPPKQ